MCRNTMEMLGHKRGWFPESKSHSKSHGFQWKHEVTRIYQIKQEYFQLTWTLPRVGGWKTMFLWHGWFSGSMLVGMVCLANSGLVTCWGAWEFGIHSNSLWRKQKMRIHWCWFLGIFLHCLRFQFAHPEPRPPPHNDATLQAGQEARWENWRFGGKHIRQIT